MPEVWDEVESGDSYAAESLATEGFIHCSFAAQLDGVIERYYSGVERIIVLSIDTKLLTAELVVEASTNNEEYPHIYGELNLDAVVDAKERILKSE